MLRSGRLKKEESIYFVENENNCLYYSSIRNIRQSGRPWGKKQGRVPRAVPMISGGEVKDNRKQLLLVEDEPAHAEAICRALAAAGADMDVQTVCTLQAYRDAMADHPPDIAMVALNLPDGRAVSTLTSPPEDGAFPILVMTSHGNEREAVEAMKAGAMDYIVKSPEAFAAIFRTITHALHDWNLLQGRKKAEQALRESEERYRTLVDNASDIVFTTDNTGHFTFVNPAGIRIVGYKMEEIIGRHYPTLVRPDMREEAMKFFGIQFVKGLENTYSEYPVITKEGGEIWLAQNTKLIVQDGHVTGFQAMARDVTARKRAEALLRESEQRYRELSTIDDLTQLYNSRHFYVQLKSETERSNRYGQPLTLLLLDLDNFKAFNDAYGHVEGDQVLSRLGQVVKRCLRETDSAYRYGGEEFTILLPMTTSGEGVVTAERIRTEFKKETFSPVSGQEVHMTVSIGLAQYKTKEEIKAFVHRVDQWMYQGKKNGKDRVCSES